MKLIGLRQQLLASLPDYEVDWLLSYYTEIPKNHFVLALQQDIDPATLDHIEQAVARRLLGEPLQYILGEQPFMDLVIQVTPEVLIPRWDSEVVVEQALKLLPTNKGLKVADICTGSGALALAIKYYRPLAEVWAADISAAALLVAENNSKLLNLPLNLVQGDLLQPLPPDGKFDMIITNPPYIPTADIPGLSSEVQQEPHLALDGGADGLDFYRTISQTAANYLLSDGVLLAEIGDGQGEAVCGLWRDAGFIGVELGYDYGKCQRFVWGRYFAQGERGKASGN